MKLQKTVKTRIFGLTRIKEALPREEYDNFQAVLRGFDASLYSATRQQAIRLLRKIRKQNGKGLKRKKEYPMILRRDVFNVRETENKLAKFWVKIRAHHMRGGIKVPIQIPKNQEKLLGLSIREGKLSWKKDHWSLHITVMKEVQLKPEPPSTILAVDLGERFIATSVVYAKGVMKNSRFYGKQVRGIRRHYAWLRKRMGERKILPVIRRIGHTERKQVNAILHKTSRDIVDEAKKLKAVIVLGDLKDIRKRVKGKRINRIVSNMPYYRMTQMIAYKAQWEGIQVYKVSERNTSKHCHKCGNEGERLSQARFKCPSCGLDYFNADFNGAINIAERFSSYIGEDGAALDTALDSGDVKLC